MKNYILLLAIICSSVACRKDIFHFDYSGINPVILNPASNYPPAISQLGTSVPYTDSAFGKTQLNLMFKYSYQVPPDKNIKIKFIKDDATATAYNMANFNALTMLPADCYEVSSTEITIPKGTKEVGFPIKIIPSKFPPRIPLPPPFISAPKRYLIAFTITDGDGITIASNAKTIIYTLQGP